jgi:hypothetical protein
MKETKKKKKIKKLGERKARGMGNETRMLGLPIAPALPIYSWRPNHKVSFWPRGEDA